MQQHIRTEHLDEIRVLGFGTGAGLGLEVGGEAVYAFVFYLQLAAADPVVEHFVQVGEAELVD